LNGTLKIFLENPTLNWLGTLRQVWLGAPAATAADDPTTSAPDTATKAWRIRQAQQRQRIWLLDLGDINTRTVAEAWLGASVWVASTQLPPAAPGEFWVDALLGKPVHLASSPAEPWGRVAGVVSSGAQDYLEIQRLEGGPLLVTPFNAHFFLNHADEAHFLLGAEALASL
jgi:ribosomal 30S subunit maturation factor RimM